jgi:SAM-dependent methyltransferase
MPEELFKSFLRRHSTVTEVDGLFYLATHPRTSEFEKAYNSIRSIEGRLYSDEVVANLPEILASHPLATEWRIRRRSATRLVRQLMTKQPQTVLEVGCGNGWLTNFLQEQLNADCCGLDVNEIELKQAVRVFGHNTNLTFFYGDVNSEIFRKDFVADVIVLASSIQYFDNPAELIGKLLRMLAPGGAIHILDSPFYKDANAKKARERSTRYFEQRGHGELGEHYFHHTLDAIKGFNYRIEYDPGKISSSIQRLVNDYSPFPWIIIES